MMYAGFWRRFAAFLIDSILIGLTALAIPMDALGFVAEKDFFILLGVVAGVYYIAFLLAPWQATFGMRLLSIYTVDAQNNARIHLLQAVGRYAFLHGVILALFLTAVTYAHIPPDGVTNAEYDRSRMLNAKPEAKWTKKDWEFKNRLIVKTITPAAKLSPAEQQRLLKIRNQRSRNKPISEEDKQFQKEVDVRLFEDTDIANNCINILGAYLLLMAIMIGITKQKTGLHDLIANTRVIRGRIK